MFSFHSDRYFTIFDVRISHRQVLLRSQKDEIHPENMDIIFFDTDFIQSGINLFGLTIREFILDEALSHPFENLAYKGQSSRGFLLETADNSFFMIAHSCKVFTNKLDFSESSLDFRYDKGGEVSSSS
ncbi:hypothetical protein [Sphingobacterium bambusae]|uniref:Uncharacterized protein n=1 Tax=Sphingobacterium bambusae TaxID=662858 RepID=A0ABW6BAU1_9SPHI|nr:hypothetical protein [Sphingobacterium bambusae]WPL48816.1 hypothetical protein SCB77_22960 [Sphingobacterium bambusae]